MRHFIIFALIVCVFAGCSQSVGNRVKTEYVEGIVSLDGEPLADATVTFLPLVERCESASGYSDANGKYTLSSANGHAGKGAIVGDYKVTVTKVDITTLEKGDPRAERDAVRGDEILTITKHLTNEVYWKADTTPLKVSVLKGKNKLNLELKSKPVASR